MRPILITSLTLMAGAWAIINDPIFQGMAVSLLFGAGVATLMAVIVIPLGCISLRRQFYLQETESGEIALSSRYELIELGAAGASPTQRTADAAPAPVAGTPVWLRLWSAAISVILVMINWLRVLGGLLSRPFRAVGGALRRLPGRRRGGEGGRERSAAAPARARMHSQDPPARGPATAEPGPAPASASPAGAAPDGRPGAPAADASRTPASRTTGKKAAVRKASAKKTTARKTAAKKAAAKKTPAKKASAKKASAKKTVPDKAGPRKTRPAAPGPADGRGTPDDDS
jgi:pyruvate/2-oxoglutarate dehydrogenase complex dihydrolipoamide acyltransferase (E2) component